jgi:tetratricopeptide (TPR) repeat protein
MKFHPSINKMSSDPSTDSQVTTKIQDLIQHAEKKLQRSIWPWNKPDDDGAAELFTQAANLCLTHQRRHQAIELYKRASDCHADMQNPHRVVELKNKILLIYKALGNAQAAIDVLQSIIYITSGNGSWNAAGKAQEALADIQKQVHGFEEAIKAYQEAVDFYSYDNNQPAIRRCRQELAQLHLELDHYTEARQIYDELAKDCLAEKLLRYHHHTYALMGGLCHLANADLVAAKRTLDAATNDNPGFKSSYEGRLLHGVVTAVESNDSDAFTHTVQEWDRIKPLENPLAWLLLKIQALLTPVDTATVDLT